MRLEKGIRLILSSGETQRWLMIIYIYIYIYILHHVQYYMYTDSPKHLIHV